MQLFLIRHAIALPAAPGESDAERPLSAEGRERFARAVRGLDELGVRFDHLRHSPLRRAVETAELCALLLEGEARPWEELAEPPSERLLAELARIDPEARTALVGHEPWMSELCALLVIGHAAHARAFPFKKGGVAWLEGEPAPGSMLLRGFFPPAVLRKR